MKRVLFIYNMRSGKGAIRNKVSDIIDLFVKNGYEVTAHPTQGKGDAVETVQEKSSEYDMVVCSGGDGTLDEAVTGMMRLERRIPIGYIPTGSTNDFGSSLKIPKNPMKAAEIAATGIDFPCDMGRFFGESLEENKCEEDSFVYIAAFGLFTDVSYATSQQMKNILGHVAYLFEAGKKFGQPIPGYEMRVEVNGDVIEDRFSYGMITNSSSIGGLKDIAGKDVKLDDGLFEVTLIREPNNPLELNDILAGLVNLFDTDMIYTYKSDHIRIESKEPIDWTMDGEYGGSFKNVDIRCEKRAVSIRISEKSLKTGIKKKMITETSLPSDNH